MGITEDLADKLAQEAIAAAEKLGDDQLISEIATVIGSTSQTTEEAFLTAVRVRTAEARARSFISDRLSGQATAPPPSPEDDLPI